MINIKKFIDCYIPTETCNLRCHYCYITQNKKFNNKLFKLKYKPEFIREALSQSRLGGVCMFNVCAGGETLLSEDTLAVVKELLKEGHFVMIVTNGTLTNRFLEISKWDKELLKNLFFKFSFHYLELIRLNWIDRFFDNVNLMKSSGASITVEITPTDELEKHVEDIKKICLDKLGALAHVTIARNNSNDIPVLSNHTLSEYVSFWSQFESDLIKFKSEIFGKKRNEFCYAGDWSFYLDIYSGSISQCYTGLHIQNIYKNIKKPIKSMPIGNNCNDPHCYNGHAFLTFGNIPELETPTYDKMRNRECVDGTKWLTDTMEQCMKCKLKDSNCEYTNLEKNKINKKVKFKMNKVKIKNKIKKIVGMS